MQQKNIFCKILFLSFVFLSNLSCREVNTWVDSPAGILKQAEACTSLTSEFDYIWQELNNSYVFWNIDSTDWDAVRDTYRPMFQELDKQRPVSNDIIRALWMNITATLIDQHLTIFVHNPDSLSSGALAIQPSQKNVQQRTDYHADSFIKTLDALESNNYCVSHLVTGIGLQDEDIVFAYSCVLDSSIVYIHMDKSIWTTEYTSANLLQAVLDTFRTQLGTMGQNGTLKGIVIDNRGNSGGPIQDLDVVISPFLSSQMLFGHFYTKKGLGKHDLCFSGVWMIEPSAKHEFPIVDKTIPIVALQDMHSASLGEDICQAISLLPNGHSIGERTMGALGGLSNIYDMYYAGPINMDNKDILPAIYTATYYTQNLSSDGHYRCFEGRGFDPDEYVPLDLTKLENDKIDNQLNAALAYIHKQ